MKEYNGELNFATDAWTSPNHRAYVAITVHLAWEGKPLVLVLDFIEVAEVSRKSHLGSCQLTSTIVALRSNACRRVHRSLGNIWYIRQGTCTTR